MCKICFEPYDTQNYKPLVLKCGHTFCRDCISKSFNQGHVICPMDKQKLSYLNLEEIGRNWDIQECMDLYVSKQKAKESFEAQFGTCSAH
jgi:hypothetical protein